MIARSAFGGVAFNIRFDGDRLVSWSGGEPNIILTPIPGADPPITERETVWLAGPSQVTWRLHLATFADLWALKALEGSTATLRIPANVQSHLGTAATVSGRPFVDLGHTLLLRVGNEATLLDGTAEGDATFVRQLNRQGQAVAW